MSTAVILIAGLGCVLLLPLVWRVLQKRFDPFEPVVLFVAAYGTVFVVRPAVMVFEGDLSFAGVDVAGTLPLVALLALVGAVGFLCGYELRPGPAVARRLPDARSIRTRSGLVAAAVLGALAALAVIALILRFGPDFLLKARTSEVAEVSSSSSYLWYASRLFVPAALLLVALAVRERSKRLALGAAFAFAASLLLTVPVGSRIFLLPLFGGLLVFAYVRRQKRPSARMLVAFLLAALIASYAALIVRDARARADAPDEFALLVEQPQRLFDPILHRADAEMAPVLAAGLTVVPEPLGYRYGGATIGELLVRPVPRALWRAKPVPPGERIVATLWPDLTGSLHPAFSPLLPLYWDFGIAGVLGGMALFGVAARALYEWFRRNADRFAAQLIFSVAIWYVVVGVRNEPVDTAVLASFVVLPLVLVERLTGRRGLVAARPLLVRVRLSRR